MSGLTADGKRSCLYINSIHFPMLHFQMQPRRTEARCSRRSISTVIYSEGSFAEANDSVGFSNLNLFHTPANANSKYNRMAVMDCRLSQPVLLYILFSTQAFSVATNTEYQERRDRDKKLLVTLS